MKCVYSWFNPTKFLNHDKARAIWCKSSILFGSPTVYAVTRAVIINFQVMRTQENPQENMMSELKVSYQAKQKLLQICGTQHAAGYLRSIWDTNLITIQEQFYALFLDTSQNLLGWRLIGTGTSKSCQVDMKLLAAIAMQCFCSKIIIAHNHPSGATSPSKNDFAMTWRIEQMLKLFEIDLLDHIIITAESSYSFVEHDKLKDLFGQITDGRLFA